MANVNATVTEIYPQAGADSTGRKIGYLSATTKAAQYDTITITNAKSVYLADLKISTATQENVNITDDDNAATTGVPLFVSTSNGYTGWFEFKSPTNTDGTGTLNNGGSKYFVINSYFENQEDVDITDDDNAATAGIAVFVHTKNGHDAWLEFVSPTNADGTGTLNNGGSTYMIFDSDAAATDGVALYFDDNGSVQSERLLCVSPSGKDLYLKLSKGQNIIIKHDASAASNGTQVYFDEDASNSYERLLSVTANNANASSETVRNESVASVPVYFDDDGALPLIRLRCVSPSGQNLFVPTITGRAIVLFHSATAASTGTQVYFDEDASNSYERLLSVTANNANSTAITTSVTGKEVGNSEPNTPSSNVISCNGSMTGTVDGIIYYN